MKCTLLNKNGCDCTTALIELSLNDKTSCITVRICFQFQYFGGQKNHLKEIVDTFLRMCRNRTENCTSAPVFRNQFVLGQLLLNLFNICTWLIDLIDGHNDLYAGCLGMVDCLYRLWHNTIVGCDNKDCDIR